MDAAALTRMIQARKKRNEEIAQAKRHVSNRQATALHLAADIRELQTELAENQAALKKAQERVKFLGDEQPTTEWEQQLAAIQGNGQ